MVFLQGNTYNLPIKLRDKDCVDIDINLVKKAQFIFNGLEKFYGTNNGSVVYDVDNKAFLVPLTEEETFGFKGSVLWQARVEFNDGVVVGTIPKTEYLYNSATDTVLKNMQ